jgi:hypothetical protein
MTYQTSPGGYPNAAPPNSSMALISLIAGILGLTFIPIIGSIVAVITGPMARKEIRESAGGLSGDGLATAGIILGWIGIGLTILGICGVGLVFLVPACIAIFAASSNQLNLLLLLAL